MKMRVIFNYQIPEKLESMFEHCNLIESAEALFIHELQNTGKFEGEFIVEQAEIID